MKTYKEKILPILAKYFPNAQIYLFGSRSTGKAHEGSDVNIAVKGEKTYDFSLFSKARNEIYDQNVPVNVDLVDFHLDSSHHAKRDY